MGDSGGSAGDPASDAQWDRAVRDESPTERLDRNWADLLQELRVVQTGVQWLTGFLLTLPFQTRFSQLTGYDQNLHLSTVAAAVAATGLLFAPVSLHRLLFRRHALATMVSAAHRLALAGMTLLGLAVVGVGWLIFDVLRGRTVGMIAAGGCLAVLLLLWTVLPLILRRSHGADDLGIDRCPPARQTVTWDGPPYDRCDAGSSVPVTGSRNSLGL